MYWKTVYRQVTVIRYAQESCVSEVRTVRKATSSETNGAVAEREIGSAGLTCGYAQGAGVQV